MGIKVVLFMRQDGTSLSDLSKSKWLKRLSQGTVHKTLIELSPSDSIIDSKSLVTGTI